jgi:hypothetical protein
LPEKLFVVLSKFGLKPFTDSVRFIGYPLPVWFDGGEKYNRGYCPADAGEDGKEGAANGVLIAPNIKVPRIIETNSSELLFFKSLFPSIFCAFGDGIAMQFRPDTGR